MQLDAIDVYVLLGGLLGAIFWSLFTWYYGIPISSSHALIGEFCGAAIAKAGFSVIIIGSYLKVVLFIFPAPIIGLILGLINMLITTWIVRNEKPRKVDKVFRRLSTGFGWLFQFRARF